MEHKEEMEKNVNNVNTNNEYMNNNQPNQYMNNNQSSQYTNNDQSSQYVNNNQSSQYTNNDQSSQYVNNNQSSQYTNNDQSSQYTNNDQSSQYVNNNQPNQYVNNKQSNNTNKTDTKIYQILSYIGFLFIVSLFIPEKDDENVKFHANQGIVLFIAFIILQTINSVIHEIFIYTLFSDKLLNIHYLTPFGATLSNFLNYGINISVLVFAIMGIINVNNGEKKELPIIGHFKIYK